MKRIMLAVTLATVAVAAASAQTTMGRAPSVVILGNEVIGQDPDQNIRSALVREYPSRNGE
jgi:hypothetical protein